jgi:hypothetical protein
MKLEFEEMKVTLKEIRDAMTLVLAKLHWIPLLSMYRVLNNHCYIINTQVGSQTTRGAGKCSSLP